MCSERVEAGSVGKFTGGGFDGLRAIAKVGYRAEDYVLNLNGVMGLVAIREIVNAEIAIMNLTIVHLSHRIDHYVSPKRLVNMGHAWKSTLDNAYTSKGAWLRMGSLRPHKGLRQSRNFAPIHRDKRDKTPVRRSRLLTSISSCIKDNDRDVPGRHSRHSRGVSADACELSA